jgi:phosphoribosyl-AMP cyclohydrolase
MFPPRTSAAAIEQGPVFMPKFNDNGLIPAIVTDAASAEVLMFAWMNAEALQRTLDTNIAHFWTRSRQKIWQKGEESGNLLDVIEIRTDCDQDVLQLAVRVRGAGVACHTGAHSCFYRRVVLGSGVQGAGGQAGLEPVA